MVSDVLNPESSEICRFIFHFLSTIFMSVYTVAYGKDVGKFSFTKEGVLQLKDLCNLCRRVLVLDCTMEQCIRGAIENKRLHTTNTVRWFWVGWFLALLQYLFSENRGLETRLLYVAMCSLSLLLYRYKQTTSYQWNNYVRMQNLKAIWPCLLPILNTNLLQVLQVLFECF